MFFKRRIASFDCNDILSATWGKCRKEIQTSTPRMKIHPGGRKNLSGPGKMIQAEHKVRMFLV